MDNESKKLARVLDGKVVRDHLAKELIEKVGKLKSKHIYPTIAIVQVGEVSESSVFIRQKKLFGEKVGINVLHVHLDSTIIQEALIDEIKKLNKNKKIQGIIVQLPLPSHIEKEKILEAILPDKDTDGLHSQNIKKLWVHDSSGVVPATARGILTLTKFYNIPLKGKHVVVIGRSSLVGQPVAHLCLNEGSTVTICHKLTKNLSTHTKQADILIVAAGSPNLITTKHVKEGQIIIDVGITSIDVKKNNCKDKNINKEKIKKICGDVDFERVKCIVKAIAPVPGGVGPLTVASLFENVVDSIVETEKKMLK